ncbi:MAG TPA: MoaD/ThiS family protein [Steroidobacteraceae bacterium]|nr:MoaD/ThiS family protein [Steroidobacteraceae bacterium]
MRITLKLFASLGQFLPPGANANAIAVEVPAGATAHQVLDQFKVPREKVHLVLLNGVYLDAGARDETPLQADDVLASWPPVAGG